MYNKFTKSVQNINQCKLKMLQDDKIKTFARFESMGNKFPSIKEDHYGTPLSYSSRVNTFDCYCQFLGIAVDIVKQS